jgi:hypothetical protein
MLGRHCCCTHLTPGEQPPLRGARTPPPPPFKGAATNTTVSQPYLDSQAEASATIWLATSHSGARETQLTSCSVTQLLLAVIFPGLNCHGRPWGAGPRRLWLCKELTQASIHPVSDKHLAGPLCCQHTPRFKLQWPPLLRRGRTRWWCTSNTRRMTWGKTLTGGWVCFCCQ